MTTGSPTTPLLVEHAVVGSLTRLLSMFAELPSTPGEIAHDAAATAREVALQVPSPFGPGHKETSRHGYGTAPVSIERRVAVSGAGLLGALAAMPSTPPALRDEAERTAEALWASLGEH